MHTSSKLALAALGLAALGAGLTLPAAASVTTYTAFDAGIGPGATPTNSNAEAAIFDTAAAGLGTEGLVTFESAPVGSITTLLTLAPGVTVTGADALGRPLTINNMPNLPVAPATDGFNTTPGGANYLEMIGGTATFTFASPIQSFGAYFTGVQPPYFQDTITFSDGTSQSVNVPQAPTLNGGVTFAGFTDPGAAITSIKINAGTPPNLSDFIGVDDVRFSPAPAVPEASTTVSFGLLLALGLGGVVVARRRKASASL